MPIKPNEDRDTIVDSVSFEEAELARRIASHERAGKPEVRPKEEITREQVDPAILYEAELGRRMASHERAGKPEVKQKEKITREQVDTVILYEAELGKRMASHERAGKPEVKPGKTDKQSETSKKLSSVHISKPEKVSTIKKFSDIAVKSYDKLMEEIKKIYLKRSKVKNIFKRSSRKKNLQEEPLPDSNVKSDRGLIALDTCSDVVVMSSGSTKTKSSNDLMQTLAELKDGKFNMMEFDDKSGGFKTAAKTLDNLSQVEGTIVLRGEASKTFLEATADIKDPAKRYKIAKEISEIHKEDSFIVSKDNRESLDKFMTETALQSLDKQIKQYQEKLVNKSYDPEKALHRAEKANLFSQLAQGVKNSKNIKELSECAEATFTTREVLRKEQRERIDKEQPGKERSMEKQVGPEAQKTEVDHQRSTGGLKAPER